MKPPRIEADQEWEQIGSPRRWTRMLTMIKVEGNPCHLEAFAVYDDDCGQQPWESDHQLYLDAARAICGDYRLSTFAFEGNDYVVILTSYGE